jgi:hypothetical protein
MKIENLKVADIVHVKLSNGLEIDGKIEIVPMGYNNKCCIRNSEGHLVWIESENIMYKREPMYKDIPIEKPLKPIALSFTFIVGASQTKTELGLSWEQPYTRTTINGYAGTGGSTKSMSMSIPFDLSSLRVNTAYKITIEGYET